MDVVVPRPQRAPLPPKRKKERKKRRYKTKQSTAHFQTFDTVLYIIRISILYIVTYQGQQARVSYHIILYRFPQTPPSHHPSNPTLSHFTSPPSYPTSILPYHTISYIARPHSSPPSKDNKSTQNSTVALFSIKNQIDNGWYEVQGAEWGGSTWSK